MGKGKNQNRNVGPSQRNMTMKPKMSKKKRKRQEKLQKRREREMEAEREHDIDIREAYVIEKENLSKQYSKRIATLLERIGSDSNDESELTSRELIQEIKEELNAINDVIMEFGDMNNDNDDNDHKSDDDNNSDNDSVLSDDLDSDLESDPDSDDSDYEDQVARHKGKNKIVKTSSSSHHSEIITEPLNILKLHPSLDFCAFVPQRGNSISMVRIDLGQKAKLKGLWMTNGHHRFKYMIDQKQAKAMETKNLYTLAFDNVLWKRDLQPYAEKPVILWLATDRKVKRTDIQVEIDFR